MSAQKPRVFIPSVIYKETGWWAVVTVEGSSRPYWQMPRMTRFGAGIAADRKARKLTRLEAKGMVQ